MPVAEIDGDRIAVATQWNDKELIKQIPGCRWDPETKTWTVPLSWTSCIVLRGVFGERLDVGANLSAWAWPIAWEQSARREMREKLEPDQRTLPRLYPFQEVGSKFLMRAREVLLCDEMGTGKTVQAATALEMTDAFPALVVCPNSVKRSWDKHIREWTSGNPYILGGGAAQREKTLKAAAQDPRAVVIVNFESLRTMSRLAGYGSIALRRCRKCDPKRGEEGMKPTQCQVHPRPLNAIGWQTVIVDEAHRVKDPKAQQTRAVWAVCQQPTVLYRWALTGTPLANHPGELWSILHAISPNDFPTKTHFVDRYCLQSWNPFGGMDIVGINPATREEFFQLLDARMRRVLKRDVLTMLPPKTRSIRWVQMTPAQRKMYEELKDSLFTLDEDENEIPATNDLIAALRRLQLSSASIVREEGNRIRMVNPSPKIDALVEILEEMDDKPVAVCAYHRGMIDLAAARLTDLKIPFGLITGAQNMYERDKALRDFQEGRVRVLLFTIAAGGVGLTMTAADTLVFLQRSWSMIDNLQAEDRVHRIGSEIHEAVHIIDVVTQDSLEEQQITALHEKFMRLQEIVRDKLDVPGEEAAIMASRVL